MHRYRAYGLGIGSALPLPELTSADCSIEIRIHLEEFEASNRQSAGEIAWKDGDDIYLSWLELGTFRVRAGREIAIYPAIGVPESALRPPILGICMAVLLHQRGLLVMHASASVVGEGAIAFLGDKGWGKSTTNAALHKRGHAFITDDILSVDLQSSQPVVYPAFPQMKLWPSAVTALGDDPKKLPKLLPHLEKRQHLFESAFAQQSVPVKALYVLGKGSELSIQPLPQQEILGHLFRHSYSGRCGKDLLQHGETAHFLQCMTLAKKVPTYQLQRPSNLGELDAIAQAIESHARSVD